MIEHTSFLYWITHPATILSIMLYGWVALAFGKAYRKVHRLPYLWDSLVCLFFPVIFYSLYIFIGHSSAYTSVACSMGAVAGYLTRTKHEKQYFEYRNTRSIMLFRDPDNVPLAPEIGVHPEKGLFVPHATPSLSAQDSQTRKILSILIGIALIFVAYVVLIY